MTACQSRCSDEGISTAAHSDNFDCPGIEMHLLDAAHVFNTV